MREFVSKLCLIVPVELVLSSLPFPYDIAERKTYYIDIKTVHGK